MDVNELRRGLLMQMAGTNIVRSGVYTPTEDSTTLTLDTHATGWKHFIICAREIPFDAATARRLGSRYVDIDNDYVLCTFLRNNPDASRLYPDNINCQSLSNASNSYVTINGSTITWVGIQANVGIFKANKDYDWCCW